MSGKLLVIRGRLQTAQGRLLVGQAPENAAIPCPCCGKTYYVELRPCCTPAAIGDVDPPFPPGGAGSRWFMTLSNLSSICGANQFGYLAFYPDKDGLAQFCMQYNLTVRPPIPASALPEDAIVLGLGDGVTCSTAIICANETVCPPCPSCCQEVSWPFRCMRRVDPHPSNPTAFVCNYGREYRITFTESTVTFHKRWTWCVGSTGGVTRSFCAPDWQQDTSVVTVGNMTFRKACAPDFVASCTGSRVSTQTTRYEDFGNLPSDCSSGTLTGGFVTENTDTVTTPCASLGGTPTFPVPEFFNGSFYDTQACTGTRLIESRCNGTSGDLHTNERWNWAFDRACFDGTLFAEHTRQSWYMDPASCQFAACLAGPPIPCTGDLCEDYKWTYEATYELQILSFDQCGGPWQTAQENDANGYPIDGGGFFDGWAISGVGDASEFL